MIYYDDSKECAPYMIDYTEEEAIRLNLLFKDYIIDPMSYDQSLAYIWRTLSEKQRKKFNVIVIKSKKEMFNHFYNK